MRQIGRNENRRLTKDMKQISLSVIVFFLLIVPLRAQLRFSDSLQVSLLTVSPGEAAYECFGHTGLRIADMKSGRDIVFHYGVYDYTEPNFIWHFVEGKCNYYMGACTTDDFLTSHRKRRLDVTEQVLWLDSTETRTLILALLDNYRPQNRNYRYNYFFDNCATRPFNLLRRCATSVQYDTTWVQDVTLREMVREMTGKGNWLDFGIALTIAGRADQPTTFAEQMFLPDYLSRAVSNATTDGHPLVRSTEKYDYSKGAERHIGEWIMRPMTLALLLLIVGSIVTMLARFKWPDGIRWPQTGARIFDTVWMLATGLTGCIVWFLNFGSEHPAVDHNLNCLWLLPTNLLFLPLIWTKKGTKVRRIYFFAIFAAVFLYIISVCVSAQSFHPAFLPWLGVILLRSADHIKSRK